MSSGKGRGKRSQPRGADAAAANKRSKVASSLKINSFLTEDKSLKLLSKAWTAGESTLVETCSIHASPFPYCTTKSFVQSEASIAALIEELNDLDYKDKSNDLYKFRQSTDLNNATPPMLKSFQEFMRTDVREFLHRTTGIEFQDQIDMFAARYDYTDYLLCHDDELEGRRIAYILYLVPDSWEKADGGALDLFTVDENHHPQEVVESLIPSRNSFVFFEVSAKSYHQVAEVLSRDKTRLTIGGWFHADTLPRPEKVDLPRLDTWQPEDISQDDFFTWINPMYFDPFTQMQIKEKFGANSEISLPGFLVEDKYAAVSEALRGENVKLDWTAVGPANKRMYETVEGDQVPDVVKHCQRLFKSDAMFLLLSAMTGLKLHELAEEDDSSDEEEEENNSDEEQEESEEEEKPVKQKKVKPQNESPVASSSQQQEDDEEDDAAPEQEEEDDADKKTFNPRCSTEIRRWKSGAYTMINDTDTDKDFALDARLFFNCDGWSLEMGGYSSYLARDEDEELLTAQPDENALVLVYRDKETLQFVKRVTDEVGKLGDKSFHDLSNVYYE